MAYAIPNMTPEKHKALEQFGTAVMTLADELQLDPGDFAIALAGIIGCVCTMNDDPPKALAGIKLVIDDAFEQTRAAPTD